MEVFIAAVMSQRKVPYEAPLVGRLLANKAAVALKQCHVTVQAQAISDADFDALLAQLKQTPEADRAPRIATAAQFCFFTSVQVIHRPNQRCSMLVA